MLLLRLLPSDNFLLPVAVVAVAAATVDVFAQAACAQAYTHGLEGGGRGYGKVGRLGDGWSVCVM